MAKEEKVMLEENSRLYIALLKERFHGMTVETFDTFRKLVIKVATQPQTVVDKSAMFSEVKALFTKHHDLIEMFKSFLYYNHDHNHNGTSSSDDSNGEEYGKNHRSRPHKKSAEMVLKSSAELVQPVLKNTVEFINRVKRTLKHEDEFKSFIEIIVGFQKDLDINKVEREAFRLFKEYPELEIEFCEFLGEGKAGRTIDDMIASKKRKWEEAEGHIKRQFDKCKKRKRSEFHEMFEREDKLYARDLAYNSMLRAKEAATRLILENSGMDSNSQISIASYFRGLHLSCLKEELKKKPLLRDETMKLGKAITESKGLVSRLEEEIKMLTRDWSDDHKILAQQNRKTDLQIPLFDWRAIQ